MESVGIIKDCDNTILTMFPREMKTNYFIYIIIKYILMLQYSIVACERNLRAKVIRKDWEYLCVWLDARRRTCTGTSFRTINAQRTPNPKRSPLRQMFCARGHREHCNVLKFWYPMRCMPLPTTFSSFLVQYVRFPILLLALCFCAWFALDAIASVLFGLRFSTHSPIARRFRCRTARAVNNRVM